MIATETVSLIIYSGEPDQIVSMEVVMSPPTPERRGVMTGNPILTLSEKPASPKRKR